MSLPLTAVAAPDPELHGVVTAIAPNFMFEVALEPVPPDYPGGHRVMARVSGKLRMKYARPRPGTRVRIALTGGELPDGIDLTHVTDVRIVEVL